MKLALYHGYVYHHMREHRKIVLFSVREGIHNRMVLGATAINMLRSKDPSDANFSLQRAMNRVSTAF